MTIAGLAALAALAGPGDGRRIAGPAPRASLPVLVHLEPGAEVGRGAPAGWTDRVVRSVPRLDSGPLDELPETARATATRFRTVVVAEVVDDGRAGFRLARVGIGNAVPVGDREVVVTPEGPPEALEALGMIDRVVLIAAEAKLDGGRLAARAPTFALYRTPTVLVINGEHREVDLCYALLVDRRSGDLSTLCWPLVPGCDAPGPVALLPADLSFDARLDARVTRRVGPVAVAWSFALIATPPGCRLEVPRAIGCLLAIDDGPVDPAALEDTLRSLIALNARGRARGGGGGSGPGRSG